MEGCCELVNDWVLWIQLSISIPRSILHCGLNKHCMYSFGYFPGIWLFYADVLEHPLFHLHRLDMKYEVTLHIQPMKMEQIECSETSAYNNQTPGKYPKEYIRDSKHSKSLKSRINKHSLCVQYCSLKFYQLIVKACFYIGSTLCVWYVGLLICTAPFPVLFICCILARKWGRCKAVYRVW